MIIYKYIDPDIGTISYGLDPYGSCDKLHREDGPARIYTSGVKEWYYNGKLHRLDGPASQGVDGTGHWWYHGEYICSSNQKEFDKLIKLKTFW